MIHPIIFNKTNARSLFDKMQHLFLMGYAMLMSSLEPTRHATVSTAYRSTSCSAPLTSQEREHINSGAWFSTLSPSLRHDIMRCARVTRYRSGDCIAAQAESSAHWMACAKGAVRVGMVAHNGQPLTLDYVAPGHWLGDAGLLDDEPCLNDLHAHGDTTTLQVTRRDFMVLFYAHEEFRRALLHMQRAQAQQLCEKIDDLKTQGLGSRLAKVLLASAEQHGEPLANGLRAGLQLPQRQLAHWVGASRQRVNEHLKRMENKQLIRQEAGGVVVQDRQALQRLAQSM